MAYLHMSACIPVDKQRHVHSLGVTRNGCLRCLCCLYFVILAVSRPLYFQPSILLRWAWLFGGLENYLYVVAYPLGIVSMVTLKATIHGATLLFATVVTRLWQPCSRVGYNQVTTVASNKVAPCMVALSPPYTVQHVACNKL